MKYVSPLLIGMLGALALSACAPQATQPNTSQAAATGSTAGTSGPARPAGGHGREAFMGSYDTNGDGVVTRAEYDAVRLARFRAADKNNDGVLSEDEYVNEFESRLKQQYAAGGREPDKSYAAAIRQAHVRFALLDRNHDGVLSQAEEKEIMDKTFAQNDTNHDGKVDASDPLPPPRNNDGN